MDDTLGALMDVNRLEQGAIVPVIQDFCLRDMLARLRSEFTFAAAGKGLTLDIEDCDRIARSDPMLLAVILRNLLGNAIKYTHAGGVKLRIRGGESHLAIDVIDTGIGIGAEHLPRIFDAFYRVHSAVADEHRGVGLGLSIVQSMSRLLAHEISIESSPGRGSRFTLQVTCGAAGSGEGQNERLEMPTTGETAPRPRGGTILHIEDDPGVARSMGLLLELEGYRIVHAATRAEALRCVQEGLRPDLILCDFHLQQGHTGDRIVAEIAAILGVKPPTIVLTGDMSDRQIDQARAIADQIVPKPVDVDVLLRAFDVLLEDPRYPSGPVAVTLRA